jgi:predicted phosphodiesterase
VEDTTLYYAIFGDIHSSKEDLEKVLADISEKSPEAIRVGTGDLYECTISKRDITDKKFTKLEDVMIIPEGFTDLLTFPSVSGNQEDRILMITETEDPLRGKLATLPETFEIADAKIIHGHQWEWGGEPWSLVRVEVHGSPVFYGHSHTSGLLLNGTHLQIEFGVHYDVSGENVLVNVGAVKDDCEWVLYDLVRNTVSFMKV